MSLDISGLFAIYDIKSENYSDLMCSTDDSLALFLNVIVNTHLESDHHLYPEDFIVYKYGTFEDGKVNLWPEKLIHTTLVGIKKPCKTCASTKIELREQNNG